MNDPSPAPSSLTRLFSRIRLRSLGPWRALGLIALLTAAAWAQGGSAQDDGQGGSSFLHRAVSFTGIFVMVGFAWLLSTNRKAIKWRPVVIGIGLQLAFALIVLSPAMTTFFFTVVDGGVKRLLSFSEEGASFVMQATVPHHASHLPGDRVNINLDEEALRHSAKNLKVPPALTEKVVAWNRARSALTESEVRALGLRADQESAVLFEPGLMSGSLSRLEDYAGLSPETRDALRAARTEKAALSPTPFGPFDRTALEAAGFDAGEVAALDATFYPGGPGGFYDEFVVGRISPLLKTFTFWILPTIIFFSAFMTVLYHLGLMQLVVKAFAVVMQKTMGTSGAETLSASANIFVGQTEAPLVVKPYVKDMTQSELHAVMVGGFATVAGGVMAAYIGFLKHIPGIAGHLVTASIMSAPAALAISKIMVPETGDPVTGGGAKLTDEKPDANVIEAAARGATEGMTLTLNVVAMLVAIVGLVAMINWVLGSVWALGATLAVGTGLVARNAVKGAPLKDNTWGGVTLAVIAVALIATLAGADLNLERILGWIFFPFALVMGVPWNECADVGRLLGEKIVLTEFMAYIHLGQVELSPRSAIIASYALCGFANFASIGIQIGGIGGIAPNRRSDLAKLGVRAMIGGTLAAFMTGTIAGILLPS